MEGRAKNSFKVNNENYNQSCNSYSYLIIYGRSYDIYAIMNKDCEMTLEMQEFRATKV